MAANFRIRSSFAGGVDNTPTPSVTPVPARSPKNIQLKRPRYVGIQARQRDFNPKTKVLEPLDYIPLDNTKNPDAYQTVRALLLERDASAKAFRSFVSLAASGHPPPPDVCDTLIERLYAAKAMSQLCTLYEVLKPLGYPLSYSKYQYIINGFVYSGQLETAIDIFRDLQNGGMTANKVTYCALISSLGKQNKRGLRNAQLAYELWRELRNTRIQLDETAYNIGMKACVDVGKVAEAEDILVLIQKAAKRPLDARPYNILLRGYARAGKPDAMTRLFEDMRSNGSPPTCVTYNTLIDGYVRAGMLEKARRCMEAAAGDNVVLDAWSFTSLMKGCVENGDLKAAAEVLNTMRVQGVKPTCTTYSVLVDGFVRVGDFPAALEVMETMSAAGERPSTVTYNALLRGYASVNNPEAFQRALQLLEDMQAKGVAPASDTFNTLMSAALVADDAEMALSLYHRMLAAKLKPDGLTYTTLIQAYARIGDLRRAVTIFEEFSRDSSAALDLPAYNAMVDAFARQGDMTAAEKMLERAQMFAKRNGKKPPVKAYGAVVSGYVRLKLVQPAVDVVKRFHAAGGTPDVQMLDMLIDLCIRTGEYKVAMQAVRAMELLGNDVDKDKYKSLLKSEAERKLNYPSQESTIHGKGRVARERRKAKLEKNANLERFKFWLGLPNNYYNDDEIDESDIE